MDQQLYAKLEKQIAASARKIKTCWEKEEAFCVAACPFHYDIREFNARLKRGSFNSAYRTFANGVGFPAIVAALCDQPCNRVCSRGQAGGIIGQRKLEQAAISYAANTMPNSYNMPQKGVKAAVVGAGLSGLGCALRLCNKKYTVTVFEQSGRIGGHLWDIMEPEIFLAEFERQFAYEHYELRLSTKIDDPALLLRDYAAVYVAAGADSGFGHLLETADRENAAPPYAAQPAGLFLGGSLLGATSMEALAQGLRAATAIEAYIKTGLAKSDTPHAPTKMRLDESAYQPAPAVLSAGPYSKEQARAEAGRCLACRCDACFRHCPLINYLRKFPLRIEDEVHVTIYPGTLDHDGTVATRLISTCSQCGLCAEVCPQDIDVGYHLRKSHQFMRNKGSMPWVFHDFWLRDMQHARDGRHYAFHASPADRPRYLYFPGCQLAASEPRYVSGSYALLREKAEHTAILLGCCGAPAVWAGDAPLERAATDEIRAVWQEYGQPIMALACPTCLKMFGEYLPEIETVSLLTLYAELGIFPPATEREGPEAARAAIFDPCSLRERPDVRQAARGLFARAGYQLEELPYHGRQAQCCSFGGQIDDTNPVYAKFLAERRTEASPLPYLTYCSNCRDIFAASGKRNLHILDLYPETARDNHAPPGIERRRLNRGQARQQIIERFFPDFPAPAPPEQEGPILYLEPGLQEKLDHERIFLDEVRAVIRRAEESGRRIADKRGHFFAYSELGRSTYWAEYAPEGGGFRVYNAYAHRMKIEGGEARHG